MCCVAPVQLYKILFKNYFCKEMMTLSVGESLQKETFAQLLDGIL
jgi:hypothetical protein